MSGPGPLFHSVISPFRYRSLGVPVSAAMCCCDSFFCRSRNACLFAAAIGQPDRLLCVFRFELTCPRPLHPGVGHFRIVSCKAKTGQDNIYTHIYLFIRLESILQHATFNTHEQTAKSFFL